VIILARTVAEVAVGEADEVRAKIESLVVCYVDGNLPRITISIGVAAFPQSGEPPNSNAWRVIALPPTTDLAHRGTRRAHE
jgi:GGDEF domain-containing protein